MECHKCKWDERNGGTLAQRQEHCIECDFKDCTLLEKLHPTTWLDGSAHAEAVVEKYAIEDLATDYWAGAGEDGADIDVEDHKMLLDFCDRLCALPIMDRLIILAMLDGGGDNGELVKYTRLNRMTVIQHRKKLERDRYWRGFLRRAGIRKRDTRTRGGSSANSAKRGASTGCSLSSTTLLGTVQNAEAEPLAEAGCANID